tara:strand:- start:1045 stop:1467 length:423 start_codon:yes stop_codon:yes gene_type:complete
VALNEDWKPEIEHIKGSDLLKKKKKKVEGLPPHLRLSAMKKAFAHTNEEADKKKGRHPRDQKELDRAQAYIKKNPKFGLKEVASYKDFMKDKEQAKARLDKKISDRKQKDKLFVDIKKRGIKFYDKKGSGRIQGGRKVYD